MFMLSNVSLEPSSAHPDIFAFQDSTMPYKLIVNGRPATVDAPADMPLLWVIRDVLNLRGTKYGCGIGQCGACTVHIGGRAVRSCQTPVAAAENARITTIEGLSPDGSHPVQVAWAEFDVPQCGYCQAGQMMSAAALLAKTPKPSDQDIDAAMNGNICRCGTYIRIRQAIHKAGSLATSQPKRAAQMVSGDSAAGGE
jgi:isoquinoline 1-oxidoreductase alpha subunit